jgi:hypothetical protein
MEKKICSICQIEKELSDYYSQNKKRKDGTEYIYCPPYCKECVIEKSKKSQLDNYEKSLEYKRKHNKEYGSKPENRRRHTERWRKSREKGVYKNGSKTIQIK